MKVYQKYRNTVIKIHLFFHTEIYHVSINHAVLDFYHSGWFLKESGESCWVTSVFLSCSLDTPTSFSSCLVKYTTPLANNTNLLN